MTADAERSAADILTVAAPMRALPAHKLIASLDAEADSEREREWMELLDRGSREIETGQIVGRPANAVGTGIRGKLDAIRRPSS